MLFQLTLSAVILTVLHCHADSAWTGHSRFDLDHNNHYTVERSRLVYKDTNIPVKSYENVGLNELDSNPPPHTEVARMSRYIVHNSDWASLTYISADRETKGFPGGAVFSVSDGVVTNGSGVPYIYGSMRQLAMQNLKRDPRCSLILTLAEGSFCSEQSLDPQDPPCAQLILTGNMEKIKNGTDEWKLAKAALFSRHPAMSKWPEDHHFFFMKLRIKKINLTDFFGGPVYVNIKDYFKAKP